MKLIIDVSEEAYGEIVSQVANGITNPLKICIANGTPIPDNDTNGNSVIKIFSKGIVRINSRKNVSVEFNKNWWNSPYQKGGK
jgi:hypothetical protein